MKQKLFTILTLLLCLCSTAWADDYVWNYSNHDTWTYSNSEKTVTLNSYNGLGSTAVEHTTPLVLTFTGGGTSDKIQASSQNFTFNNVEYTLSNQLWINGASNDNRKMSFSGISGTGTFTLLVKTSNNRTVSMGTASGNPTTSSNTNYVDIGTFINNAKTAVSTITVTSALSANTTYYVNVSGGIAIYALIWTPDGAGTPSFSPTTGSSVAEGSKITITSSNSTSIKYKWTNSTTTPTDGWSVYDADAKVTVPAASDETPYLHAQGFKGEDAGTAGYAQYTITAPDTEAPTLSSTSPAANATDIAVSGNIVLTFNENVFCTTKATLTPEGGEAVELTPTVSGAAVTYAYTELAYNKAYTFNLAANSVADGSGNKYASAINFSFTTVQETCATPTFIDLGSKAVKITCATEASTIYYKLNDGSYTEYSGTFIPEANGTIYAYATAEGCLNSAVAEKAITLPVVGNVTGNLLMTLQPDVPTTGDAGDYSSHTFSKAGYSMANTNVLQNTGAATRCPNMFKVNKGTITITPPSDVTIQSIKIFGVSNNTVSTPSSVSAGTGTTMVSSTGVLTPRNYYVGDDQANGDPIISEVVFSKTTPTAGATFEFKLAQASGDNSQVRLYVEVYGTTSATTEAITPAKTYTTYIPTHNLDFTSTDKLTAYIATAATASTVTVTSVDKVPAGTPIIVKATETGSAINVNVAATADDVSSNKLKCGDGKTNVGGNSKYDYILSDGKFYRAEEGTIAVGKAYLHLDAAPAASRELSIVFEGETTGIANIEVDANEIFDANAPMYNLAGQRVNKSYKGVVIVNGKKMLNK